MISAGIDTGSTTTKAVILEDRRILAAAFIPTGPDSTQTAQQVMEKALSQTELKMQDIHYTVSTGYGRTNVPFAQKAITEISCHARGTVFVFPKVRTILDMGGQDCKVIRCDEQGLVQNFVMNDKCSAGTGRYLDRMAKVLRVPLTDMGELSLQIVERPATVSSFCTVFAQYDVINLLRQGKHVNDILAGVSDALAERTQALIKRVGMMEDFSISGGVAKNTGIVKRLEKIFDVKAYIAPEPLIIGALGAALFAQELAMK